MDEKARETQMKSHGKNETGEIAPIKKGGEAATSTLNPEQNESKVKRTNPRSDWEPYLSCLSYHSHPIRPCGAPSPRGEGCDTRIPSSKKGGEAALVNLSAPQVPSSRAQPRDLYCTTAICLHAPSLKRHLSASFFAFPSPTFYRSARKISPFRPS